MELTGNVIGKQNNKHAAKKKEESIAQEIQKELTEQADIDLTGVNIVDLTAMISENGIIRFDDSEYPTMKDILPKLISTNDNQSFIINDIGVIIRQYRLWKKEMPRVEIFYAVKCNSDLMTLRTLANLGVGFDVASKGEIAMITELDIEIKRDKIIYANPCKSTEYIQYARSQRIYMMTFDNVDELLKVKLFHPNAELVLRILVDDSKSRMPFGSKFGCPMNNIKKVLGYARFLDLSVIGVSFHVGSCCLDASSFSDAIKRAKTVFDIAQEIGYNFHLLDIGGGFSNNYIPGEATFSEIAIEVNKELENSFGNLENLRVIAEPGRFFATSTMTLVVSVTGKKLIVKDADYNTNANSIANSIDNIDNIDNKVFHYTINSSIYGMFNNIIFDKAVPDFKLLNEYNDKIYKSVIFGETCDSADTISTGIDLPELACGDCLYVENHGAYTLASASSFNGFKTPKILHIFTY